MRLLLAVSVLLLSALSAHAASGLGYVDKSEKVAASGKPLRLGDVYSVEPDCSVMGSITIRLLAGPAHGKFVSRPGMVFPSFPANNPHSACNGRRVLGRQQTYTSQPGYTGPDAIDFEIIFPDGHALHVHTPITVM